MNFSIMNQTCHCVVSISLEILQRIVIRLEIVFLEKKITRSSICRGIFILGKDTTYTNGNVPSITTHVPSCKYTLIYWSRPVLCFMILIKYILLPVSFQSDTFNGSLLITAGPYSKYTPDFSNKDSTAFQYFSRTFLYQVSH